jgi:hypothetical protein
MSKRKLLEWGGVAAGVVLIGFGIASLVLTSPGTTRSGRSSGARKSWAHPT